MKEFFTKLVGVIQLCCSPNRDAFHRAVTLVQLKRLNINILLFTFTSFTLHKHSLKILARSEPGNLVVFAGEGYFLPKLSRTKWFNGEGIWLMWKQSTSGDIQRPL